MEKQGSPLDNLLLKEIEEFPFDWQNEIIMLSNQQFSEEMPEDDEVWTYLKVDNEELSETEIINSKKI